MTQQVPQADKPFLGILLMLGFCAMIPFSDALAKYLGAALPVGMLVLVRFVGQAAILLPVILLRGISLRMSRRAGWLTVLRTVLQIVGIGTMFMAFRYMPLADAIAIAFVMPFFLLFLGRAFAGETVGPHRFGAALVGFVGTLLVIQPNFVQVGWVALLPLLTALAYAFFMLTTRAATRETSPLALQALSGLLAVLVLLPLIVVATLGGWADLRWVAPTAVQWGLLILMAVIGTGAHFLMTLSLRFAPSATLAPMQYVEIPMATIMGLVVFGDWPNGLALFGIAVTVAAGLYIIAREQRQAKAMPPPPPAPRAAESPASPGRKR